MQAYRGIPRKPDKTGKVRDIFDLGDSLIIVATDRISAFDGVLGSLIPGKGYLLNQISNFFFQKTGHLVPNHLIETDYRRFPEPFNSYPELEGRAVFARKGKIYPFECIVRGYLMGSGYKSYRESGQVSGIKLPEGLEENARLPEPIFTPTTKADEGHDAPVTFDDVVDALGQETANLLREKSLQLYRFAADYCLEKGIVLADTKLEFAEIDGELVVADEMFTPDSSRYLEANQLKSGEKPYNFDKQFVRNYLLSEGLQEKAAGAVLPDSVIESTVERYEQICRILTGSGLPD